MLVVSGTADCGGTPCVVVTTCAKPSESWRILTKTIDGKTAANLWLQDRPHESLLSCGGTSSPTGPSGPCHLWGDGKTFADDRNDVR